MTAAFATAVYALCFITSAACALLLGRSYSRTGTRLLLWSALCFACLAANNFVVVIDLVLLPQLDLSLLRQGLSACGIVMLLVGFIFGREE